MKNLSKLQQILDSGQFAVTAEIGPPKHSSAEGIRHHAEMMRDYVDATNITDNQTAIVRLSSIAAGVHVLNCGIEPIVQMTCRDRNRIAMQSDLMGAYSLGMRNVLCLSGDHQKFGNHPTSKNVYDIDSMQLIYYLRRMRDEKLFFSGEEIKEHEPRFFIGAVANPFADPFEFRVDRLEKKVEAGAQFIQTQCIFDMERFERFMEMVRERGIDERVHILAGVTPMKSWRAAKYIQNNVSGMIVPDELVERLKNAEDPKREGVDICIEQIKYIKENVRGVHGVHVMAIAWEEVVPEIVERSGLYPRPKVG
ncbi:methylenetetrahydrofolate reductase [Desulfallas thermosapovorans]|uniref:Methylenetetrahydrofolate reductase n=1 Tax=Desulfallas thermosapovorans DSM 6562 TaxID=1121431 RepID=A0A5S4ZXD2_9FIRM|nr:methylenetetrahydrofolate reductase [Desulfallas thermosapovorans]TYO90215.1 5,10-methylenetetrahydrofolate reductase (ferredoxin) [Desulfallas thermosapovorans DSM 6562]TYO97734.1 5,10-methylenetetrahydrofolate reductase (ferredoxin) [Desulfallas thermosapovorans DSM 6562]